MSRSGGPMKAFRIQKPKNKREFYIAGEMVASFRKPVLPRRLLTKVSKPLLYDRKTTFEVELAAVAAAAGLAAVPVAGRAADPAVDPVGAAAEGLPA